MPWDVSVCFCLLLRIDRVSVSFKAKYQRNKDEGGSISERSLLDYVVFLGKGHAMR